MISHFITYIEVYVCVVCFPCLQFMHVYNPANAVPIILERINPMPLEGQCWHTKTMYKLNEDSLAALKGCTLDMCTPSPLTLTMSEGYGDEVDAEFESAADQWAELGGGW